MAAWGQICQQIYIWNYNTNFSNYLLPCPNLRVIEPNLRYFVANRAKGAFMQAAGNANGAEFSELRNYVISQLLWDPSRGGARLVDEFLTLHYGPAAGPIREFIQRVHDKAESSGRHRNCFGRLADYGLDQTDAEFGLDAFARALALADSETLRQRVEKASICAYRAALEPVWYVDQASLTPDMIEKARPLARQFFSLCDKYQVDRHRETDEDVAAASVRLKQTLGLAADESF
jgi:hypothetical protein